MNITRTTERMQDPEAPISPLGILGELENSLRLPHSEKGAVSLPPLVANQAWLFP